jgi:hypothetical protein
MFQCTNRAATQDRAKSSQETIIIAQEHCLSYLEKGKGVICVTIGHDHGMEQKTFIVYSSQHYPIPQINPSVTEKCTRHWTSPKS